uniref:Uncharacterized protein n=1 Tax=mine drainage metagenome TaxID=410659 RepID=E6QEV7_9ZZZZ
MRSFVVSSGIPHNIQLFIFYHIQPKWEGFPRCPAVVQQRKANDIICDPLQTFSREDSSC